MDIEQYKTTRTHQSGNKSRQRVHIEKHRATRAWLMWSVLAVAFMIVLVHRVSPGILLDCLIADFRIQEAAVAGTLAGMYSIIYCIMQIPAGLLADFWGPRKTVTTGMLVAGLGSLLFALAPNLFYAFIGRGVIGLGVAVVLVSNLKFLTFWFKPSQFTTMTGLTMLVGNLGGVLATSPLAFSVQVLGWRGSHLLIGAATFCIAALCWFLVLDRSPIGQGGAGNPGKIYVSSNHLDNKKGETPALGWQEYPRALKTVLKNPHNLPLFSTFFGIYGTLLAFSGAWGAPYLRDVYGFTRQEAAKYLLAVAAGISLGYFLIGFISDKVSRRKWPSLLFFALYILTWAVIICWEKGRPPVYALYPLFFIMGIAGTANVPHFGSAKELNDPAYSGLAVGVVNVGAFAGAAILQPLWGYILDWKKHSMGTLEKMRALDMLEAHTYPLEAYRFLFILCLIFLLFCFGLALSIKETRGCNIVVQSKSSIAGHDECRKTSS